MFTDLYEDQFTAALAAAEDETPSPAERAEMLMEIAMGLQYRPKDPAQLKAAADLCDKALSLCPDAEVLLKARITARAISIWPGRCSYSGCAWAIRPSGPKISSIFNELMVQTEFILPC